MITLNEQEKLGDALASVSFCDELLVVDSGSTDGTAEIARRAGAKVIENEWPGFAKQRNLALENVSSDWVLEIDADERVTAELRESIKDFLSAPESDAYEIAAMSIRQRFLGRALGGSARYPDYRHRLFRRDTYRHDETRTVHEGLVPKSRVWALEGDLVHELAGSLREAGRDSIRYARLEAKQIHDRGVATALTGIALRPSAKFLVRMFVFRGWRDGWRGWLKIWLDCTNDALVWTNYLLRERRPGSSASGHFAREHRFEGPPRLIAMTERAEAREAHEWLERAAACGADVALLVAGSTTAHDGPPLPFRIHPLRPTTLAALRALDEEWQLRPYDALVPFGRRMARIAGRLPGHLRGRSGILEPGHAEPAALVREMSGPGGDAVKG